MSKIILGIETSCDETAAAVLEQQNPSTHSTRSGQVGRIQILSNIIGTSAQLQEKFGGVIPEQAAREQLKLIIPVIRESLRSAQCKPAQIDAIAVTFGPGLIGSLLVGVETAKTLATVWQKPLIPVNHLIGHFYANWIFNTYYTLSPLPSRERQGEGKQKAPEIASPTARNDDFCTPSFPCIGLLVSGGHSDLVLFKNHGEFEYLGGTRDDAAGECFDKCARLLGFPYPGGPKISKIAEKGDPKIFKLPRPMWDSNDYDFSFSGLKTAFATLVEKNFKVSSLNPKDAEAHWKHIVLNRNNKPAKEDQKISDICASLQQAIIGPLVKKTVAAAENNNIEQIIVAGGVAANQELIRQLREHFNGQVLVPPQSLCTDNAAMIASAAFFIKPMDNSLSLQANPNLSLETPIMA